MRLEGVVGLTVLGRPRTSGDAGPYLARTVFAGGWGLAVGGLVEEAMGRADRPRVLVSSCPRVLSASQVGLTVLGRPGVEVVPRSGLRRTSRDAGPYLEVGRGPAGTLVPT